MIIRHLLATLATGIALMMSSCSSDDMDFDNGNPLLPDADFDVGAFTSFVNPTSNTYLTRTDIKTYEKLAGNSTWKEFDLSEMDGGHTPGPSSLLVKEGKIYTPLVTFSCATGPTRIGMAMYALGVAGKIDADRPVMVKREYTLSGNKLTLNGEDLYVKNQKNGSLWLSAIMGFIQGGEVTEGSDLYVMRYDETKIPGEFYKFDNVEAVYEWVLDAFREKFGKEVNLNHYLTGVILDNPMLTAAEIEQELGDCRNGRHPHIN
ncbi:MAG: hypothetical protein K2M85_03320 [Paramuribaculum sp.]|nr:hypothetical protein [Paramuribaculum sp.]